MVISMHFHASVTLLHLQNSMHKTWIFFYLILLFLLQWLKSIKIHYFFVSLLKWKLCATNFRVNFFLNVEAHFSEISRADTHFPGFSDLDFKYSMNKLGLFGST